MMQWFVDDTCRRDDARIPIGYPLPGNRLALVDEEGRATPPGEVGELIVGSPYVSLGRWVDGRLADESVETGGGRGRRIFRTGDLVRQRPDGLLERARPQGQASQDTRISRRSRRRRSHASRAPFRARCRRAGTAEQRRWHDDTRRLRERTRWSACRADRRIEGVDALRAAADAPARFYLAPSIPRLPSSKLDIRALAALDETHVQRERAESIDEAERAPIAGDHISQTVARVWQRRVARAGSRSAEDDFFDSGGDSLKAITFVIELERALGLEISLTLINEAPRFDQLCQALRERRAPGSTPLVTLKAGDGLPPVFFIHGVGGNVVEILPTARRVTYPGAVIGIRARGVVRGEVPHTSIEAMAADYLREIKERQPNGPYHLCGYSSGGLVAFEIARRLSESGDEVGLVGLFDTTMSPVRWPLRTWLAIVARRDGTPRRRVARHVNSHLARHAAQVRRATSRVARSLGAAPSIGIRVAASALIASAKYHPGFYRGQLTLFSPAGREPGLPSLESVWRKHARTVVVVETAGTH